MEGESEGIVIIPIAQVFRDRGRLEELYILALI